MPPTPLSAESLVTFSSFYARRISEAGGARDDTEELALARDILQAVINDGLTPTADGGASYIRRGALDWSDPATIQAAQATSGGRKGQSRSAAVGGNSMLRSKELLQGLAMLAAVLVIAGWYVWPLLFGPNQSTPAKEKGGTPTPEVVTYTLESSHEAGPTPAPTLQTDLLADIVEAGGVKTGLVAPRTLEIKGVSFVVQPVRVLAGDWPLPDDPRAVSWVYGTVVNYALGLTATPENQQLLASLQSGDELLLRLSTGVSYRFAVADLVRVAPHASEIFRQNRPGLILALLGDEAQPSRVVLRGVYVPNTDPDEATLPVPQGAVMGELIEVNDSLRLACLASAPLALLPDTPAGYINVSVDFRVENRLPSLPLGTAAFAHQLEAAGVTYPAIQTLVTRTAGRYPPLPATLRPGQVVTTTAIYAVPEAALSSGLIWRFTPDPAGGVTIRIALPAYRGPLEPELGLQEVNLSANGALLVKLKLRAPALRAVEVNAADLQVQGGLLSPVGNVFPWHVAAGQTGQFDLLLLPDRNVRGLTVALWEQGLEFNW